MAEYKPTRIEQIVRCTDEIAALLKYPAPRSALLQAVGQMDWLDELHRILYEEQDGAEATTDGSAVIPE